VTPAARVALAASGWAGGSVVGRAASVGVVVTSAIVVTGIHKDKRSLLDDR
jgi:hypothetical protein